MKRGWTVLLVVVLLVGVLFFSGIEGGITGMVVSLGVENESDLVSLPEEVIENDSLEIPVEEILLVNETELSLPLENVTVIVNETLEVLPIVDNQTEEPIDELIPIVDNETLEMPVVNESVGDD